MSTSHRADAPLERAPSDWAAAEEMARNPLQPPKREERIPVDDPDTSKTDIEPQPASDSRPVLVRVRDDRGRPLPNIAVRVEPLSQERGPVIERETVNGVTASDGLAVLEAPCGTSRIHANFERANRAFTWECKDHLISAAVSQDVAVTLYPATCNLAVLVRDDNGEPLEGVSIQANYYDGTAKTDRSGRCVLEGLPPTQIFLVVNSRSSGERKYFPDELQSATTLVEGQHNEAIVTLQRAGSLTVVLDAIVAANGSPIAEAHIEGNDTEWRRESRLLEPGTPVTIGSMPPGRYEVRTCFGATTPYFGDIQGVEILAGEHTEIFIRPEAYDGEVHGTVVDEEAGPVAGIVVDARPASSSFDARCRKSCATDEGGRFKILGLPERVAIAVDVRSVLDNYACFGSSTEPRMIVPTHGGEAMVLSLAKGYSIVGDVRWHGEPHRGQVIIDHACYAGVEDRTTIYLDTESKEERFVFHHLRPGRYRVWLDGEDPASGIEVVVGPEYTPSGECRVSLIH